MSLDDYLQKCQLVDEQHPSVKEAFATGRHFPLHGALYRSGKKYLLTPWGVQPFEEHLGSYVLAGEPLLQSTEPFLAAKIVDLFLAWAHRHQKPVCGYYFSQEVSGQVRLRRYRAGVSRLMNLKSFNLSGYRSRDIRRALNQGERGGLSFRELNQAEMINEFGRIDCVVQQWLKTKMLPQIGFLLSKPRLQRTFGSGERWFLVERGRSLDAFVSILPYQSKENHLNFYVDHMIQAPNGHRFALDFLFAKLILQLTSEGAENLSFGFNAFQKVRPNSFVESLLWLNGLSDQLYNAKGIYSYKRKFTNYEQPRYMLLDPKFSKTRQIMALLKATWS